MPENGLIQSVKRARIGGSVRTQAVGADERASRTPRTRLEQHQVAALRGGVASPRRCITFQALTRVAEALSAGWDAYRGAVLLFVERGVHPLRDLLA